jgi:hypothetical protein
MAVRSKTGAARIEHQPGPPKLTSQGKARTQSAGMAVKTTRAGPLNWPWRSHPAQYNISLQRRADYSITLQFKDSTDAAINLTGWTVEAQAWNESRSTKYADFTVTYTNRSTGTIAIALTDEQTALFPNEAYYDVLLTNPSGLKEYYLEGIIYVSEGYTG